MAPEKSIYDQLRKRAEARVTKTLGVLKGITLDKAKTLLHELEVHQIELEMQNEELREAQHRLEVIRDQYTDLFDFAPVGYLILDNKGVIVNINLTACDLLGIERALIKGKPLSAYMSSGESKILFLKLQEAFKTGRLDGFELEMKHKNKATFTALLQGAITSNTNLKEDLCRISFQDVTTIKEAEVILQQHEALQKEKEKIQQYLDLAPVVFLLIDTNNKVEMINQKGCDLIDCTSQEIIGRSWFQDFICDLNTNPSNTNILNNLEEEKSIPTNFESKLRSKTGEMLIMSWTNVALLDKNGILLGTLVAGENITERKKAELRKERYTQDLEDIVEQRTQKLTEALHNEKMVNEMKTAFVSMASHEFRTPLTSVLSSTILIEKYNDLKQYPKQKRHIERIKGAVGQLTSILEDFLSMDKLERGIITINEEAFDLKIFTEDILKELEFSLKENQYLNYHHIGSSMVVLDRKILRNIFLNLITNAIKYSDVNVLIHTKVKNNTVQISFIDKGIGIPEEDQKNLFSKFFRAKNVANIQGTGLGLSIVKHYVDLLEGTIIFESKLKEGSKFYITLPQKME
ncbi:sensor histidine kinase [Olleya namhaensis]|uniref:sensor histidine kinase n=1 Tax=Olleya namhaensis TaxID=1144750 RepID=UPI00249370B1|nr:PAS domain-containing sensor histidine kinase [Olleya namhaensis]